MSNYQALIVKAQQGDHFALNQLFTQWYPKVYNIAHRYFADAETAREISQQSFLQVQQKLGELKDPGSFKVWLYRTTINLCHLEARRIKNRKRHYEGYRKIRPNGLASDPEELYQKQEQTEIVLAALQKIPAEQRTVIIMKEYEGLKFREIAAVLDISENTAKSRLYYGLSALRKFFLTTDLKKEVHYE